MRFRITTGLSAEEIRDALSEHIEPKVFFRNYLKNGTNIQHYTKI